MRHYVKSYYYKPLIQTGSCFFVLVLAFKLVIGPRQTPHDKKRRGLWSDEGAMALPQRRTVAIRIVAVVQFG